MELNHVHGGDAQLLRRVAGMDAAARVAPTDGELSKTDKGYFSVFPEAALDFREQGEHYALDVPFR